MILIYTPKYEGHAYTPREYAAMQVIEQQRSAWYTMVPVGKRPGFVSSRPDIAINKVWQLRDRGLHRVKSADAYPYQ
jgi:hypothetical protein